MKFKSSIQIVLMFLITTVAFHRAEAWWGPLQSSVSAEGVVATDAFANPDPNGHQKVIDAIDDPRTKSVEMWMYSMSDPKVIQALRDADARGTKITIIFNQGMYKGHGSDVVNELTSGTNIQVYEASSAFSITHAKTFIVNAGEPDAYAWIMSMNMTQNFPNQADFAIRTSDSQVVTDLSNLFQIDEENAQDSTALGLDGQDGRPELTSPNLVVSPQNSLPRIMALINSAQTSIDMTVENLTYYKPTAQYPKPFTEIVDALAAKMQAGVQVRVITPSCDMNWNPGFNMTALNVLNQAASPLVVAKMMPYPASPTEPYMHQKLIIVDHKVFFIGSENLSINSLDKAREIGVIVKLTGPAAIVQQDFDQEFNEAVAPAARDQDIPQDCQAFSNSSF